MAVVFGQVVRAVEPEVPAGWLVVAGGVALRRIPVVARALAAPGTVSRLELPHSFRVAEGAAFLLIMALGHPPAELYAGRRPGQRKGNAMNTRSSYPDVEVPEISLPWFVLDRADERGKAVSLMGPADPGTATPVMLPNR